MTVIVDAPKAIEIAENFLEKHHDTKLLKSSKLGENGVWSIIFDVGFLTENLKTVKVDSQNGKILGYE